MLLYFIFDVLIYVLHNSSQMMMMNDEFLVCVVDFGMTLRHSKTVLLYKDPKGELTLQRN